MDARDELTIGEVARRSGLSVPAVRHFESKGLIASTRTAGNQRRYPRHVLRRLAFARAGQRFGLSLAEVASALATLPSDRPATRRDWERLSRQWQAALQERINALVRLKETTDSCIGCGCLSTVNCPMYNAEDHHAAEGPGARRWPADLRVGDG